LVVTAQGKDLYEKVRSEADALGKEILDKVAEQDMQVTMRVLAEVYAATEAMA
jgi:MarR family transcriptional regulator for hemolysin